MHVPRATGTLFAKLCEVASVVDGAVKLVGENHSVECNAKIVFVELIDHLFRIREYTRVPDERSVFCIPSRRAEACTQVNHRVTRKFLLAKCFGFLQNFFPAGQGPMRLLIAKTP